jgi:dihydropyrimidinase
MTILIKNGRIITDVEDYTADIFIEKGKIRTIFSKISSDADIIIDASDKYVIPGGIDAHTHLDMPLMNTFSSDNFESGTIAAAYGGTTTIIDYPTQNHGSFPQDALQLWFQKAEGKACIDYGFHMILTDTTHLELEDLNELVKEGITSFKLFMAYPGSLMLDDRSIFELMRAANELGSLICIHAENGEVIESLINESVQDGKTAPIFHALSRPASLEGEAINRSIALAQVAGCPVYIVHVSTYDGLKKIMEARDQGTPVYADTCPQYLLLSLDDLIDSRGFESAKYVFTPPLRELGHQEKLWEGIAKNHIQVVATDHCPFNLNGQKDFGKDEFTEIPDGAPGIENRLHLMYEFGVKKNRISLKSWVDLCATRPAKIFGLYPMKGTISVDSDADVVIWDPKQKITLSAKSHHMNVDYNLYEGYEISGSPTTVISNGEVIIDNHKFVGKSGRGRYLKRDLFSAEMV